jgi:HSP20 family molecular chaperone IbpA
MLLEMPGADPEKPERNPGQGVLTVSARSTPFSPPGYTLAYANTATAITRSFTLPQQVDSERAEAVFKNGVLRLTPKVPSPAKKIAVKSA